MDKLERVMAVLQGQQPDRAPVSFWYHFGPGRTAGPAAVEAHVRHVETYDLDFLKVMDDNRYPRPPVNGGVLIETRDLEKLTVLNGDEGSFGRQLELIVALNRHFEGRLPLSTTLFNAWSTLRQLAVPDTGQHGPGTLARQEDDPRDVALNRWMREAPDLLQSALDIVAESLGNYARQCRAAGAHGIFLSVRDDQVDTPQNGAGTYDRFVRAGDLKILSGATAAGGSPENGGLSLNIMHVCGRPQNFARFTEYPVDAINWADRSAGPAIAEVAGRIRPALCAGVDHLHTLISGSPDDCRAQVADAMRAAAGHPLLIAPGCTYDPQTVPPENLHAVRRAVESS